MSDGEHDEQIENEEESGYTAVEIIKALQITNADRLAFLSIFERFAVGIEANLNKLRADLAEMNAGINARNEGDGAISTPNISESEPESEPESE